MKRTMKKHLSLLLAVLMILTSVSFSTFAADTECTVHETAGENPQYRKVINPTCEEGGYTEYYCINCGEVAYTRNPTLPLNHQFGDFEYESNGNGAYRKFQECKREYTVDGKVVKCGARSVEKDGENDAVYYLVKFINNKVTASYDETITYTEVVNAYKSQELYSCYVKSGNPVEYEGKIAPSRGKTKEFGAYSHIGWTTNVNLEATQDNNLTAANCTDLSAVNANLVLYPVFRGEPTEYLVTFYDYKGDKLTWEKTIAHGGNPQYSFNGQLYGDPTKDESFEFYYDFVGWLSDKDATPIPSSEIESVNVYGPIHFHPYFSSVKKNFTIAFYGPDEKTIIKYGDNNDQYAVFDGANLADNLLKKFEDILKINNTPQVLEKESDDVYTYTFKGWRVLLGDGKYGTEINLTNFSISANDYSLVTDEEGNVLTLDNKYNEPKKVVRLVPVYERKLRTYAVDIEMQIPYGEDADYDRKDAVIHVTDYDNQLVASGRTDKNGKFRCYLNYRAPFTVTVATADEKYLGTATISSLSKDPAGDLNFEAGTLNLCRVGMELNPEYEKHCSCIHHNSLLQPLIVRIFNILYSLFNVKYVCCYDMYSTIGPLLGYTQ